MKKRLLCLALTLLMLMSLVPVAALAEENPFTDVPKLINDAPNPFYDAILWAVDQKITTGYSDATFRPNATCTRGHVVTFLWRAAGSPAPDSLYNRFTDVSENSPFFNAILWAAEQGITTGYSDGSFRPNDACTRAHVVTFLWRYDKKPAASGEVSLVDLEGLNADFTAAIKWAATNGITTGYSDGTFRPHAVCTRAHVVTFIYRDVSSVHRHSYTAVKTLPTCTTEGYTTYTCSCGETYKGDYVAKAGHSWNEGVVTVKPTISSSGEKLFTCTVCGETRVERLGLEGHVHSYVKNVVPPACAEDGYTEYVCECGDSYIDQKSYVIRVGHRYTTVGVKEATCTEDGYSGDFACMVCGEIYKDPSGNVQKGHTIAATGHTWGTVPTKTVRPTRVSTGMKVYTCTTCGAERTEIIPCVDRVLCLATETTTYPLVGAVTWTYEHDEYGNIVSGVLTNPLGMKIGNMTATYFDSTNGSLNMTVIKDNYETEITEYDEASGAIKTRTYKDSIDNVKSTLNNTINEKGLITKSVSTDSERGETKVYVYTYNAGGQVMQEVFEYSLDDVGTSRQTTNYLYANGRLSAMNLTYSDSQGANYSAAIKITYDANGRETRRVTTTSDLSAGNTIAEVSYAYDSAGNLISQINKVNNITIIEYTYSYAEYGGEYYVVKETQTAYSQDSKGEYVSESTVFEYGYVYK